MDNLAVLLWQDVTPNTENVPGVWPAQVQDLGESTTLPDDGQNWQLMTQDEYDAYIAENQATYDAWAAGVALAEAKVNLLNNFSQARLTYVNSHYTLDTKFSFFVMFSLANAAGLTNRANYIHPLFTWAQSVLAYAATVVADINALPDLDSVNNYSWDFDANVMADPGINLFAAISITN